MFRCELCNQLFRDNHNLNRHINRKKKCVPVNPAIVNDFGKEDLSHIDIDAVKIMWKNATNYGTNDERSLNTIDDCYRSAGNVIVAFQRLVKQNNDNDNTRLSNIRNNTATMLIDGQWKSVVTDEIVNNVVITRSGQLITTLTALNVVFNADRNKRIYHHLVLFNRYGLAHNDSYANTRNVKMNLKLALTRR